MGQPKEGLILPDGRPLMAFLFDLLKPIVSEVYVVGASRGFEPAQVPGLRHLPDREPGLGPMGGLRTLLESGTATRYLLVTCDQPRLTRGLLDVLIQESPPDRPAFLQTQSGQSLAPFPSLWPEATLAAVRDAMERGERSPRRLLRELNAVACVAPVGAELLVQSVNTPGEWEVYLTQRGKEAKAQRV